MKNEKKMLKSWSHKSKNEQQAIGPGNHAGR
jgi:hypothetical protein